jgi:hypothetical protein
VTRSELLTCDGRPVAARLMAFRRLALDNALAELIKLYDTRGVRPLLLKGPAFARWLYDDPRERSYNDIDLLVRPDEFGAARRGLAELSYEPAPVNAMRPGERRDSYHEEWIRPGTLPLAVELHHTLYGVPAALSLVWQRLTEGVERIEVAGVQIDVPAEAVSALIAGLHRADHGNVATPPDAGSRPGAPRRADRFSVWAGGRYAECDLQLALARVDIETWGAAAAIAGELGAAEMFAFGLRLDPAGRRLADRLGLTDRVPRQVRLRNSHQPATTNGIERLISTPGAPARIRLVAGELVPSRAFMRYSSSLARRGRRGLVGAYLWRPVGLMIKLPKGLRAWMRVATPMSRMRSTRRPR